jgi:hypothetical protein
MTCAAELVVGVCLNEGPEAALNGTEDHMNSLHFVPVCNRQTQKKKNEKYVHGDKKRFEFEQASKLLTIPETQIFFCYIHQCFRAFCPIHPKH